MTFNIYTCVNCKRHVIEEERKTHECKPLKEYKIIANTLWVCDGEKWYPLKLKSTENLHGKDQPQNGQNLKTILL